MRRQHLDRDGPVEARVHGLPDHAQGDRILVGDFENTTDRVEYRAAVRDVLEGFLAGSDFLDVIRRPKMRELVEAHAGEPVLLTPTLADEICGAGECEGYVTGSLEQEDHSYRIEVRLFHEGKKRPLELTQVAASDDEILESLWELARDLRGRAGEDPEALPSRTPLHTSSLLAMQSFVLSFFADTMDQDKLLRRTIELDPEWAEPHGWLANRYLNVKGRWAEARTLLEKSLSHPEQLSEDMLLQTEAIHRKAAYDFEGEIESWKEYRELYPWSVSSWQFLGGRYLQAYRDPATAELWMKEAFRLRPASFATVYLYAWSLMWGKANKIDAAIQTFRENDGEEDAALAVSLMALLSRADWDQVLRDAENLSPQPGLAKIVGAGFRLTALLAAGRLSEARGAARAASTAALESGNLRFAYLAGLRQSWLESRGRGEPAGPADEQLEYVRNTLYYFPALATLSVDLGLAEPLGGIVALHEELEAENDARFVREELAFGHACLALIAGQTERATEFLEPLARGSTLLRRHRVLGRAYEELGAWDAAAAEYEQVLANPYDKLWDQDNPAIFVLDQFRLAQIYEQLGNTNRARHWYERFLDDWKDADPDIPEVIEARERMVVLTGVTPSG